jgi:LacI family transcriptional regulator
MSIPDLPPPSNTARTMRELAHHLGISASTVSLALRNDPRIALATREKVLDAAHAQDYRPNPMVQALMAQIRTHRLPTAPVNIGYVTAGDQPDRWKSNAYYRTLLSGARERAESQGYCLEEIWIREPGMTSAQFDKILCARNIPGIIIAPHPEHQLTDLPVNWDKYAMSTFDIGLLAPSLHRSCMHTFQNSRILFRILAEKGYQRIGIFVSTCLNREQAGMIGFAFQEFQTDIPQKNRVPMLEVGLPEHRLFRKWYDKFRPDVVVTQDEVAIHTIETLGLKVPEEIAIALLTWTEDLPRLSGINPRLRDIGTAAMDIVTEQLLKNEKGIPDCPKLVLREGIWHQGETTR